MTALVVAPADRFASQASVYAMAPACSAAKCVRSSLTTQQIAEPAGGNVERTRGVPVANAFRRNLGHLGQLAWEVARTRWSMPEVTPGWEKRAARVVL